ncbi:hypothetical protein NLJ89_g8942 [Agrocybe chaxingu]|uniref:Uncharacterized protein n=1 Tax=Agrocybe chaxingu TaxID=84603 RepID=A0A9W8JTP4_9AGAR|nr:hypothetical protein NLJ89_g8942 [Agrocybe chaxingu]
MMSQYTIAALVGTVIDRYGPGVCSLISALSFSSGFGGFAFEVYRNPDALPESATALFYRFTFFFLLVGLGTVFGYFSALFAASKSFPNYSGVASGTSMAFFGLSPLCFSVIASAFFTDSAGALNVTRYMSSIALLTAIVYTLGFINMRAVPRSSDTVIHVESDDHEGHHEEERPLLPPKRAVDPTVPELLQKTDFWMIALVCVLILGVCEMIISNIGTIVVSLPPPPRESTSGTVLPNSATASQVNLISIANTISRISVGPLADFISPVAAYLPTGAQVFPRKHIISRFAFLAASATLLVFTFTWMVYGVRSQGDVWVLSVGTGLSYSAVFTIFLGGLAIDTFIRKQYGGHFQYLTIQGLAVAWLTMVASLFTDLLPSIRAARSIKRYLMIMAMPLAVVVSSIYWTLLLFFPALIIQKDLSGPSGAVPSSSPDAAPEFRLPLSIDLALHAAPALSVILDFFVFERKYNKKEVEVGAPAAISLYALGYTLWVEHCARENDGIFPYPFLTENTLPIRIGIYVGTAGLATVSFKLFNSLHS